MVIFLFIYSPTCLLIILNLKLQMDNVISQAQATLGALVTQRSTFGGITSKITNVSSRLPTVHFSQTPLIFFLVYHLGASSNVIKSKAYG